MSDPPLSLNSRLYIFLFIFFLNSISLVLPSNLLSPVIRHGSDAGYLVFLFFFGGGPLAVFYLRLAFLLRFVSSFLSRMPSLL